MSHFEGVMRAFLRIRKTGKPPFPAQCIKPVHSSGQDLVYITLMSHIKNKLIFRTVKYAVHRDRRFHNAEIGCEVSSVTRDAADQKIPDLRRKFTKFIIIQFFYILRKRKMSKHLIFHNHIPIFSVR